MPSTVDAELNRFAELVERQNTGWIAAAQVIVGDRHRAEEVVQDVLGRAYSRWAELDGMDKPGAWIRRAVINDAISVWRRMRTEDRALSKLHERRDDHPVAPSEPDPELWAAVRDLPEDQCRAVALRYGLDASVAEAAIELDLSLSAAKTLLYRARQGLRKRLPDEENDHVR